MIKSRDIQLDIFPDISQYSWSRKPLPSRFSLNAARTKLFTLRLLNCYDLCDLKGERISGSDMFLHHGREVFRVLLSSRKYEQFLDDPKWLQSFANRFFFTD